MVRYDSYKDSGVEWVGNIPSHWTTSKTKYFFESGMGETILGEDLKDEGLPVWSSTELDKYFGYVSESKLKLNIGDLVIPGRGVSIGYVKRVFEPSTTTQTTIYLKKKGDIEQDFIYYLFNGFRKHFFFYDRTSIPQITVQQVLNNILLLPPLSEQQQIVSFLDSKISQIDSLTDKTQRKIELLKEKRTSLSMK